MGISVKVNLTFTHFNRFLKISFSLAFHRLDSLMGSKTRLSNKCSAKDLVIRVRGNVSPFCFFNITFWHQQTQNFLSRLVLYVFSIISLSFWLLIGHCCNNNKKSRQYFWTVMIWVVFMLGGDSMLEQRDRHQFCTKHLGEALQSAFVQRFTAHPRLMDCSGTEEQANLPSLLS